MDRVQYNIEATGSQTGTQGRILSF